MIHNNIDMDKVIDRDRNNEMQVIFSKLTEANKDILLLIANSIKIAQENTNNTGEQL